MRTIGFLCCLGVILLVAGCTSMTNSLPSASVPLEKLKTDATYDVIGPATGTASGGTLFGFIPVGGENTV